MVSRPQPLAQPAAAARAHRGATPPQEVTRFPGVFLGNLHGLTLASSALQAQLAVYKTELGQVAVVSTIMLRHCGRC